VFHRHAIEGWELQVRSDLMNAVLGLDLTRHRTLSELFDAHEAASVGRTHTTVLDLADAHQRIHLRRFRHGGWLAPLSGGRLAGLERPLAELEVAALLSARGLPVARPALVIARRHGLFWEAAVGSMHEEACLDGLAFLMASPDPRRLIRAARAAGAAIRRLHDAGAEHADLHIKNLLIREQDERADVIVIDLDRARIHPAVSPRRRFEELMRLQRSLRKRKLRTALDPQITGAFFLAYIARDVDLAREMLQNLGHEQRRGALHALLYHDRT